MAPKRVAMASSILSRMSEPPMPALATARRAMISRSWASMTRAARTLPLQQPNSKPSEHPHRVRLGERLEDLEIEDLTAEAAFQFPRSYRRHHHLLLVMSPPLSHAHGTALFRRQRLWRQGKHRAFPPLPGPNARGHRPDTWRQFLRLAFRLN